MRYCHTYGKILVDHQTAKFNSPPKFPAIQYAFDGHKLCTAHVLYILACTKMYMRSVATKT